jgi:hypothetical protein
MLDIFEAADKHGILTVPNDTPGVCAECQAWWDTPGDEWPPEKADYVCPNDCTSYEWYAAESSRLRAAAPWWNPVIFERLTRQGMLELVELPEYGNGFAYGAKWRITTRAIGLIDWLLAGAPGSGFGQPLPKCALLVA